LLLEERQMGARPVASQRGRVRLLGGLRLPQLRRSVERAAVLGRLTWRLAEVAEVVPQTARTATLLLDVEGWPGHRAGQHIDVRLTAEDGYRAQRSYSIASASEDKTLQITVEELVDGEVSLWM